MASLFWRINVGMGLVAFVQLDPAIQNFVTAHIEAVPDVQVRAFSPADDVVSFLERHQGTVEALIIGAEMGEPISLLQRLYPIARDMAVLLLANHRGMQPLRQALQFAPFVTDYTQCLIAQSDEALKKAVIDAVHWTRMRREYARTLTALQQASALQDPPSPRQAALYLDHLLDRAPVGILVVDLSGRILVCNRAVQVLFRRDERSLLGQWLMDFFPDAVRHRMQPWIEEAVHKPSSSPPETFEREEHGRQVLEITAGCLEGRAQEAGCLLLIQDVTARYVADEQIQALNQALQAQVRQHEHTVDKLRQAQDKLHDNITDLEKFHDAVVGRELEMMKLEKEVAALRAQLKRS